MGSDYRGFQDKMMGDISQASAVAQSQNRSGKGGTRLRLRASDLEALIPSGSTIEYSALPPHRMRFGDIVLTRQGAEVHLRRFAGFSIVKGGAYVQLVSPQQKLVERLPDTSVVGKVTGVEVAGKMVNPLKKESWSHAIANRLTCFGTSSVGAGIGESFKGLLRLTGIKK